MSRIQKARLKAKWAGQDFLETLGAPLPKQKREGELQLVSFHGICADDQEYINGRFLKIGVFERLLDAMNERYHLVSLADLKENNLKKDRLNILITFDDGYLNNFTLALPELEKRAIPAIFFITKAQKHWPDFIDLALSDDLAKKALIREFSSKDPQSEKELKSQLILQEQRVHEKVLELSKMTLGDKLESKQNFWKLMSTNEHQALMRNNLVDLCNHSSSHRSCREMPLQEFVNDVLETKAYLKELGSEHTDVFAYPFGHYTPESIHELSKHGFDFQFGIDGGTHHERIYDRLVINPFISLRNQLIAIENGSY